MGTFPAFTSSVGPVTLSLLGTSVNSLALAVTCVASGGGKVRLLGVEFNKL
jgi:hypothetical protein